MVGSLSVLFSTLHCAKNNTRVPPILFSLFIQAKQPKDANTINFHLQRLNNAAKR